jgi:hypothetical protein
VSSYTSSTTRLRANATILRQAIPGLDHQQDALISSITSAHLGMLTDDVNQAIVVGPECIEQLWRSVDAALPGMKDWLSESTYGELACAESIRHELGYLDPSADPVEVEQVLEDAHTSLVDALEAVQAEIAMTERLVTTQAIAMALPDLGYSVLRADGPGVTGFAASRGHEKLLVEVTDGGHVVTDHIGLSDGASCGAAQASFVDRISTYGIEIEETSRTDHRDTRGGSLAVWAARSGGRNLAEGVVGATLNRSHDRDGEKRPLRQPISERAGT